MRSVFIVSDGCNLVLELTQDTELNGKLGSAAVPGACILYNDATRRVRASGVSWVELTD